MLQKKLPAIVVAVFTLFITYLHYSSIGAGHALHSIYRELYYIPVLLGALAYGLKGHRFILPAHFCPLSSLRYHDLARHTYQ